MFEHDFINHRITISDPIKMAKASGFLWNKSMMIQMNCRGYASAQFMQPEPSKYSKAPNMEAQSFMQPEQDYFAHHAGRFFYVKCLDSGKTFSVPYEPMRCKLNSFEFSIGKNELTWQIEHLELAIKLTLSLPKDDVIELWELSISSLSDTNRNIAIYAYFSIGYMSWMNQSASYDEKNQAIIANSVTPYQQVEDYFKNSHLKDKTYLMSKHQPTSWCANQHLFEGEGGLHNPDALNKPLLEQHSAYYQTPVAVMQFNHQFSRQAPIKHLFLFGPARDLDEIAKLRSVYLKKDSAITQAKNDYHAYLTNGMGCVTIESPDKSFNELVNHWLPRQVFYHGDVNRLTTDPQTRNYLQDAMGMAFINPQKTKFALLNALSQQSINGAMPDGILLHQHAKLKYINLVPHSDHAVWLTICLECYLRETNDVDILTEQLPFKDSPQKMTVVEHINLAFGHLLQARDNHGLSYIAQGDWCDPMNMVGYLGKGVSAWLTVATAFSLKVWRQLSTEFSFNKEKIDNYQATISQLNQAMNHHFWQGDWYARGITDHGKIFGCQNDKEGAIYLNPQSWAILSGAATQQHYQKILSAIEQHLMTPYGVMMLAPSYTQMDENIGRITQKFPGVAENGSVYNHAAAFYAYSLFQIGCYDKAFNILTNMVPTPQDAVTRQQLPSFIPNYYRGAYHQLPEIAGRSSQLFNTGTTAWFYRCVIEELCGLKGLSKGLMIDPKLPTYWSFLKVTRIFRGATFYVTYQRKLTITQHQYYINGEQLESNIISNIRSGQIYRLDIFLKPNKEVSCR